MLVAAGALAVAGACAPGGSNTPVPSSRPTGEIQTDPAKAGELTLTVWDQHTEGGSDAALEELNKRFEQKYPNVTIKRVSRSFNDLKTTLKLALSGDDPPDVVQANQGYPDMGAFVQAGLLTPMDGYAEVYGWDEAYPSGLLDLNRFSSDGKTWQEGDLYGVSQTGEIVGLYYNKKKLADLGLQPPKTFAEFEAQLPKIKAAGELPIQFGTADRSPSIHLLGVVLAATAGKDKAHALVTGAGDAAWNESVVVEAIRTIESWSADGYLTRGANGLSSPEATAAFARGEGVYFVNGTWAASQLQENPDISFMNPPPAEAGASSATLGGVGLAWAITSKSEHADVAAAYIDFITSEQARDVVAEKGELPALKPPTYTPEPGSLSAQVAASWDEIRKQDGLVPYLDYATPTFYDTLTSGVQQVIGGQIDAKACAEALQADFGAFQKNR